MLAGGARCVQATTETSVAVTITKPRGDTTTKNRKRTADPAVGPGCKRCKEKDVEIANLEKMNAALRNDKAALRQENTALRNILDADIGGARAELGAVEPENGRT